jgi:hypothetical protein
VTQTERRLDTTQSHLHGTQKGTDPKHGKWHIGNKRKGRDMPKTVTVIHQKVCLGDKRDKDLVSIKWLINKT